MSHKACLEVLAAVTSSDTCFQDSKKHLSQNRLPTTLGDRLWALLAAIEALHQPNVVELVWKTCVLGVPISVPEQVVLERRGLVRSKDIPRNECDTGWAV